MRTAFDPLELAYVAILYGGFLLLWRVKRVAQRSSTGEDPEVLGRATRPVQRYFAQLLRVMTAALIVLVACHAAGLTWPGLTRLTALDRRGADHAGLALGVLGLSLCAVAQWTMGAAWRVGIDEGRRTPLIERGVYAFVRNPTYLGLFAVNAGLWLVWPTASIGTFAVVFFVVMELQVRCEEEHLEALHGEAFRRYRDRTRRYLPFLY